MQKLAILEGYANPFGGLRRRKRKHAKRKASRRGGRKAQQKKFKRAAKHCKLHRKGSFRACMSSQLSGKKKKK